MTQLAPFIKTILDAPDERGPRYVLADYLEERGDERAALLRMEGKWLLASRKYELTNEEKEERKRLRSVGLKHMVAPASLTDLYASVLIWDAAGIDDAIETPLCVVGAIVPQVNCQMMPPYGEPAENHYATASVRMYARWLCWSCATSLSRYRNQLVPISATELERVSYKITPAKDRTRTESMTELDDVSVHEVRSNRRPRR